MFSPVKATVAGALVFVLGGMFLIAQPFDQPGSVPGAEQGAELASPVAVSITDLGGGEVLQEEQCTNGAGTDVMCTQGGSSQWSATDPRLSGVATTWVNEHTWEGLRGGAFEAYAVELVNDEGRWLGTGRSIGNLANMVTLTGEGGYEGLAAVLVQEWDPDIIKAVIVDGGLPPFPELPAE